MSSAKAKLHLLYAHSEQAAPRYETLPVPPPSSPSPPSSSASAALHPPDAQPLLSAAFFVKPSCSQPHGFQCLLHLPDLPPVLSDVFPKKKDAEQDAAKKALSQLGKPSACEYSPPPKSEKEKITALTDRIGTLFSEKMIMNWHPLKEHFRAAVRRKDDRSMMVPAVALTALDNKLGSLCKSMSSLTDCDPSFSVPMIWKAAKQCPYITCIDGFWIKKVEPFSSEFKEELLSCTTEEACSEFQAVYIPSSPQKMITNIEIKLGTDEYYMDVLANVLGVKDGAAVMISRSIARSIARAPRNTRLYWPVPKELQAFGAHCENSTYNMSFNGDSSEYVCDSGGIGKILNSRAANFIGYPIDGDAVLASVGSTWRSEGKLACADLSVCCYYRLLLGRTPEGSYKLSRDSVLVATLPRSFSSRSQWRGGLPRPLLIDICQQHHLREPLFSFSCDNDSGSVDDEKPVGTGKSSFKCKVTVTFNGEARYFESERLYRSQYDAANSAALRALHFLSQRVYGFGKEEPCLDMLASMTLEMRDQTDARNGPGKTIAPGSVVSIAYDTFLTGEGLEVKVESREGFEFEYGVGGIMGELENAIYGMAIGACEHVILPVSSLELVFAANEEISRVVENHCLGGCSLRYELKVLGFLEPPEERMEAALFSPPLSKQRNGFAIRKLQEVHAKSLVDLGCGSGSLLDAVLDSSTDLEHIVGVDISHRSLVRAAKSLNSKLGSCQNDRSAPKLLKKAVLYEGSLAEADYRLCDFDVATCIEVVEHMDPEPLCRAGEVILGMFAPRMLILSTPNIEYNVILQKISADASKVNEQNGNVAACCVGETPKRYDAVKLEQEVDGMERVNKSQRLPLFDEDAGPQMVKLRNDDHRFEWTRAEFADWATNLASRFGYSVEFTGVGGTEEDPGYASQIAIFTRNSDSRAVQKSSTPHGPTPGYREIWKYNQLGVGITMT